MRLFLAKLITPKSHKVVPVEPSEVMLDVEFYGDLGSGFNQTHKWLRAGEYYFSKRQDAVTFGRNLYKAMIDAA